MADVIVKIKSKLNAMSEEQQKRQHMIADWEAKIQEAAEAGDFSFLANEAKDCEKGIIAVVKGLVHKAATEKGFVYDKVRGEYAEAAA